MKQTAKRKKVTIDAGQEVPTRVGVKSSYKAATNERGIKIREI